MLFCVSSRQAVLRLNLKASIGRYYERCGKRLYGSIIVRLGDVYVGNIMVRLEGVCMGVLWTVWETSEYVVL